MKVFFDDMFEELDELLFDDETNSEQSGNGQFVRRSILNNIVAISVDAARASSNLTLLQKRLISLAISKIDSRNAATDETRQRSDGLPLDERTVVISAKDYADLTNDKREATRKLQIAVDNILSKRLIIYSGQKTRKINYLSSAEYYADSSETELVFNPDLFDLITNLSAKRRFIKYRNRDIQNLNLHAINLMELLKTYKQKVEVRISNIELRQALNAKDKYKSAKDLRVQVIEPAIKELDQKNWDITFKVQKSGRRITAYLFKYSINKRS